MKLGSSFNKLLKNRMVLYVVVFLAVANVLGYFSMRDMDAITFFALVGFLTHQFSKNMIVVLLSAIIFTNLIKMVYPGQEGMKGKKVKEGLDNEEEGEELYDEEEEKKEEEEEEDEGVSLNIKQTAEEKKEAELKKKQETYDKLKNDFNEFQSIQHDILKNMKEIDPLLTKAENFIAKFEQFKKN